MNKRGKVLRDPHAGPGLLMVEGRQYQFWLDNVWTSDVPPKPGLVVDVTFNARQQIQSITAVSQAQLEREQALTQEKGTKKLRRILWNAVERCFH
jgi:hypothetical protein